MKAVDKTDFVSYSISSAKYSVWPSLSTVH